MHLPGKIIYRSYYRVKQKIQTFKKTALPLTSKENKRIAFSNSG